jgi:hypothetical protein
MFACSAQQVCFEGGGSATPTGPINLKMGAQSENWCDEVVDVMRVPQSGDATVAIAQVPRRKGHGEVRCDVLIVGGGTGGVAAALAAARRGRTVTLVEETDWLGGQMTAQGISALDEHPRIKRVGGTRSYYELRRLIRRYYEDQGLREGANPGHCWVSELAFEPVAAVRVINGMLGPYVKAGLVNILLRTKVVSARRNGNRVQSVTAMSLETRELVRIAPDLVIEATELGDLFPLVEVSYATGAEAAADTGEPHAQPGTPKPHCIQSFTYAFAVERTAVGADHRIDEPLHYRQYRDGQPYSLMIQVHGGEIYGEVTGRLEYSLFKTMPGTKGSLWTYRRLIDRELFPDIAEWDVALMNWPGNDFRDQTIIDVDADQIAGALQSAKQVSLGFLYWLQTEAPTGDGRLGAPELRLKPDVMGSIDGLSKHPYIRESRRMRTVTRVVEQDVSVEFQHSDIAAPFSDSAGIGWYPIDIHAACPEEVGVSTRTRPFQIPLGALISVDCENLLAGAKNIGTTHITNGCYRLHPVEWNIGEAAGLLAAWSLEHGVSPAGTWAEPRELASFQRFLLEEGVPLTWVDVSVDEPAFIASHVEALAQP